MDQSDRRSPYLREGGRLADVMAAIQVMSSVTPESQTADDWTRKIGAHPSAGGWLHLCREHPEFFRVNDEKPPKISLRWRHGLERTHRFTPRQPPDAKEDLCRPPLEPGQIETLMRTAVEMHSRAVAAAQERRWIIPLLFALGGVVLGAVLQALLR